MKTKTILFFLLPFLFQTASYASGIDKCIDEHLKRHGLSASAPVDAARLVRRYYLAVTDRVPTEKQASDFIDNPDRVALVDSLLLSDGFVRKQVLKWGDLLRIKSEFPSCMWPNAVQAFNKWLAEEFRDDTPYNLFVAHLLSGTGSNFREPSVNFYRAGTDRRPSKFCSDIALLFLGRRSAPQEWESFFCQVKFKTSKEWKEEILCLDIDAEPLEKEIALPGRTVTLSEGSDFREPFVSWLTAADNRELAKAYVNRLWFWITGEALISPVDDIEGRTASNPALLDYLTDRFLAEKFSVRALAREILLSDAFCRSTLSCEGNEKAVDSDFAVFPLRRLGAEQLCDSMCDITGVYDKYSSRAPEPFTNFPYGTHANEVCDGTITTPQLDIFGKPSRDVALESSRDLSVNAKQMLYLLNSSTVHDKIEKSPFIKSLSSASLDRAADRIYLRVLSRHARPAEIKALEDWSAKTGYNVTECSKALMWALFNTDEFLFIN